MAESLGVTGIWPQPLSVAEATRGTVKRTLTADEATRAKLAQALGLDHLAALEARMTVTPWLDGVQIEGDWTATVGQTCGVTLDPFDSDLSGHISVRALPAGSAALGGPDEREGEHELDLDPDADDPPDVLQGPDIDLGAYVAEDLSLAIDPFPRKPGVAFEAPEQKGEPSPFAVLAKLKGGAPDA